MVFYFTARGHVPGKDDWLLYMGKDKYENEDLIRHSLPQDIWFHVDNLSSAHVYLRLPEGKKMDDIPPDTLEDACQLVKANSIQGNKESDLWIVYTPASNLRKTASMEVGQVGFHNTKAIKKAKIERRINEIVNRLNRTQQEKFPDLAAEKDAWLREQRGKQKAETQAKAKAEKEEREAQEAEKKQQAEKMSYKGFMDEEVMVTQADMREKYKNVEDYEDDFM